MKRAAPWICALLCLVFVSMPLLAANTAPAPKDTSSKAGAQLASTLSQVTGVAISPLLGVSALGAYKWTMANTEAEKAALPWYASPLYWMTGLLIVGGVALKDAAGTALPPGWKKPLDVLETMENKLSGLVAVGAFVPFTIDTLSSLIGGSAPGSAAVPSGLAMIHFAMIDWSWLLNLLLVPFGVAVFLVVWITSHAINVLILLSPWGAVDALLKTLRLSVLGLVALTANIDPTIGIIFSLLVVVVSYFLAGWAFRLTVYGSVFCWDFFTFRRNRFRPAKDENWVFAGKRIERVPIRSYGRVSRDAEGRLVLKYRPWLVLPERAQTLPDVPLAVGRGAFFPTVEGTFGESEKAVLILPPRYKGHEEAFAEAAGIPRLTDVGLRRAWGVLKELLGLEAKSDRPAGVPG